MLTQPGGAEVQKAHRSATHIEMRDNSNARVVGGRVYKSPTLLFHENELPIPRRGRGHKAQ